MSRKTVRDVDSIYSGSGGNKRSRISDDISCWSNVTSAARWASILSCCWRRRNREEKPDFKEYNPNEWDYIVEKLVVKRVPLSFYATEKDTQEFFDDKKDKELSFGPIIGPTGKEMRDKQVYSAMQAIASSSYFFKNKTRGDLSNETSSKNLRFNRDEDLLDEDAAQAGPSNYNKNLRIVEAEVANEYLNKFSSLHPDLKENERPPKDPNPLNPPSGSRRSLAENMSEIAASTRKNLNANKSKKVKERIKQGSEVYITVSDTSREISNLIGGEEIPTRDKHTASICRKMGSTACLPYPRKLSKTGEVERREVGSANSQKKPGESSKDRDFNPKSYKGPQFDVHCVSCEHDSADKPAKLNPCGFKSRGKNELELPNRKSVEDGGLVAAEATSNTSADGIKGENPAGTTLRWKIIIKHHQPTASETAAKAPVLTGSSNSRTINDSLNRSKLMNANTDSSFDKILTDDEMQDHKNSG